MSASAESSVHGIVGESATIGPPPRDRVTQLRLAIARSVRGADVNLGEHIRIRGIGHALYDGRVTGRRERDPGVVQRDTTADRQHAPLRVGHDELPFAARPQPKHRGRPPASAMAAY
jgi:hypothetical protein